jgi:hypothetical protein
VSEDEQDSPLAKRVYDLRHACLTTWLNSGVPAAQVAEWAGNSVPVLQAIYIKCIAGDHDVLKKRIEDTLQEEEPPKTSWRIPDDQAERPMGRSTTLHGAPFFHPWAMMPAGSPGSGGRMLNPCWAVAPGRWVPRA